MPIGRADPPAAFEGFVLEHVCQPWPYQTALTTIAKILKHTKMGSDAGYFVTRAAVFFLESANVRIGMTADDRGRVPFEDDEVEVIREGELSRPLLQ